MEVIELSQNYKFEKREKYLSLKWKISHVILYLTCSLIGFAGSAVVRILESSLDHACLFYSNITALEDKNEGKWYVTPITSVWSKHHCYGMMFVFTISFAYGMIWTVYFFTCAVSQYKYKAKQLESFQGYGPLQRLVLPALVFNVVMTLITGPVAVDAWYGLVVFCKNLMKITNSYTCLDAARLVYFKRDENSLENAKMMADLIRILGVALFFAWILNTVLLILRVFYWPDYNLLKEIKIEFRLHDKPGKDVSQLYKERVRIWKKFLRDKGLTGSILQSVKEIEFTFPCLVEGEKTSEVADDFVDANEDAFNIALTESSSTATNTIPSEVDSENNLQYKSAETLQLTKRRSKQTVISEDGGVSNWVAQGLQEMVDEIVPNPYQDDIFQVQEHSQTSINTVRSIEDSSGSNNVQNRKDLGAGTSKTFRKSL